MTELNIDVSLLSGSPEIDSVAEWVPKVLAVGGLIITERDGELTIQPKPNRHAPRAWSPAKISTPWFARKRPR